MEQTLEKRTNSASVVRPPIVVVVGHIDHGKSTLIDYIRKTRVTEKEAGGITQGIGAYQVTVHPTGEPSSRAERGISPSGEGILRPASSGTQDDFATAGRKITFIDTPGHEAFSAMRQRGTKVADVAVLVVAADEGVKPQTEEAIRIIREAELPFVVAINKTDKPSADPMRVRKQLAEQEVLVEGFGGTVPVVELSAKTGQGVGALLETILLLAELEGLAADPAKPGEGVVIESHLDPKRGATATLLVEDGTVRQGDWVAVGDQTAPVRIFENFLGQPIGAAGAGEPIRVVGFGRPPQLGERFVTAKTRAETKARNASATGAPGPRARAANGAVPMAKTMVNIVLKTDVLGSQEALEAALAAIASPELSNRIVKSEVGDINESDVKLAAATKNTFIAGFKVKLPAPIKELADRSGVSIVQGDVIYNFLEAVKSAMLALAPAEIRRVDLGTAKILALFKEKGGKQVVGGKVERGMIRAGARFEITRNNLTIGSGKIIELQSNRRPASEVPENQEFGVLADADISIAAGDALSVFTEEKVAPSL